MSDEDERAMAAIRLLAESGIESGESGAAGLARPMALCEAPKLAPARELRDIDPATCSIEAAGKAGRPTKARERAAG